MSGCPERFPQAPKSINQKFYQHQLFLNLSGWLAQKPKTHEWLRAGSWVDNESIRSSSRVAFLTNENMFKSPAQERPSPETSWGTWNQIGIAFAQPSWVCNESSSWVSAVSLFMSGQWKNTASVDRTKKCSWVAAVSWKTFMSGFLSWVAAARVITTRVHVSQQ